MHERKSYAIDAGNKTNSNDNVIITYQIHTLRVYVRLTMSFSLLIHIKLLFIQMVIEYSVPRKDLISIL